MKKYRAALLSVARVVQGYELEAEIGDGGRKWGCKVCFGAVKGGRKIFTTVGKVFDLKVECGQHYMV